MVSPASFQVGCRSYIPFVVDFSHDDMNGVWTRTDDVLLDGPMSTVPQRYKNKDKEERQRKTPKPAQEKAGHENRVGEHLLTTPECLPKRL